MLSVGTGGLRRRSYCAADALSGFPAGGMALFQAGMFMRREDDVRLGGGHATRRTVLNTSRSSEPRTSVRAD